MQHGPVAIDVSQQVGDFVIRKGNGTAAYQLAVVVDDASMGVTEVVRGDDLLASTARQLLLYRELDLAAPTFCHVPLVVGPDGLRLAKRHGDTRVEFFRRQGITPERVVGLLAFWSGLIPARAECTARELINRFDWRRMPRDRVVWRGEL
jgi:glutamyl-tRNA synthetase